MSCEIQETMGTDSMRPSLPPLFLCSLGLWAACAITYSVGQSSDSMTCGIVAAAGGLAVFLTAVGLWRGHAKRIWCLMLGLALGLVCGSMGSVVLHEAMTRVTECDQSIWQFEAVEDATPGMYGTQCLTRAHNTTADVTVLIRLTIDPEIDLPLYGDVFETTVAPSVPQNSSATYCWQHGAAAVAWAGQTTPVKRDGLFAVLLGVRTAAINALGEGGKGAGVLQALVCGYRANLSDTAVYNDFKTAGLAHLVAVSGAHLVIVSGFIALALRVVRAPRALAIIVQIVFLLMYLVLAAAPVSAVRAAVMAVVGLSSYAARRRPAPINALALCIMVLVATTPSASVSVSFALSAGSTLGIVLLSGLFASWLNRLSFPLPQFVRDAFALTFAAGVVTIPASAALFAQISLISPLANACVSPLFAVVCTGGLVATTMSLIIPAFAPFVLGLVSGAAEVLIGVVEVLAAMPFACIPASASVVPMVVVSIVATFLLWLFWPRLRVQTLFVFVGLALVALCAIIIFAPRLHGNQIIMLDVGQGDAFLITSEGSSVLIDTGNRDLALREGLARHGVWQLDAIVLTHGDDDHCGSLTSLRGVVEIGTVCVSENALSCGCDACRNLCVDARMAAGESALCGLRVGDVLRCGAFEISVVWPYTFEDEGGNADSVCLLARIDADDDGASDWSALFCGDVEADQIKTMVDAGVVGKVDVYKVGHHGSRAAIDDKTAAALSPSIALVSVGANNRYGHPASETLQYLENAGAAVFRTDEQGDVSCELDSNTIRVTTLR